MCSIYLVKSFPSNIESQCCHEFQTACLADENKNTYGVGGKVTDVKGDSLDTVCCFAVAVEVFWNNQSALTNS